VTTEEYLARHDSQIARLEQVMTALAEAQVRTEDEMAELVKAMKELALAQAKTAEAQAKTERQWQAYINTLPKN
jgi:peptidoglycan hydrolase CwlO-like protein